MKTVSYRDNYTWIQIPVLSKRLSMSSVIPLSNIFAAVLCWVPVSDL